MSAERKAATRNATLFALAALLVTGAAVPRVSAQETSPVSAPHIYVALGSSYASGPGVGQQSHTIDDRCLQSADNYAHIVARRLHLPLVDESCAGSTTDNVLRGGQYGQKPQIDALTSDTRLVTLTSGGNDVHFIGDLFSWSCTRKPNVVPRAMKAEICKPVPAERTNETFSKVERNFREIVREIHRRSPKAQIVFVDYSTLLPARGDCPGRLPISDSELGQARGLAERLGTLTARVARQEKVTLIEASRITSQHQVCSSDPWMFGWTFPTSGSWGPTAYHPRPSAMNAIARAVISRVGSFSR